MSGPEFLALAWRLPAYSGAMAARVAAEEDENGPRDNGQRNTGPRRGGPPVRNDGRRVVDITDPVFAPYVERVVV